MSIDILNIRLDAMYPGENINIVKIEGDRSAMHYGYFINNKLVGTASLFIKSIPFQIRKVAVLPEYQSKGIGSRLIKEISNSIDEEIFLNARIDKIEFYKKLNFQEIPNTEFMKNGFTLKRMVFKRRN